MMRASREIRSNENDTVVGVRISHPDRLIYPQPRVTKFELARYYEALGDRIVRHVRGRPLTLVHCPAGILAPCSYMRHTKVWGPNVLRRVRIREKTKIGEYLVADDLAGVVGLIQMGVVEIHTWNSTADDVERPDRIVWDLDPGPEVGWPAAVAAARQLRDALRVLGLESWVKTTGGAGLHVVMPLTPRLEWAACLEFSRRVADVIVRSDPARFTTAFAKTGRETKILIDYLRNNRTNTSVAAFSTRAREGAPVSLPIAWQELTARLRPASFTVATVPRRLEKLRRDPWDGYFECRQRISKAALAAVARI
jgi:bifunctional non-homologous end joining protein LigD